MPPITEFALSVDDFESPKKFKNAEAVSSLLIRLLLLEPGTIQSHPDMGVGIISKYRFSVEGAELELQKDFEKQIEKYLPQFQGARVSVSQKNGTFMIGVKIDGTLYGIHYDTNTSNVKQKYTRLADL